MKLLLSALLAAALAVIAGHAAAQTYPAKPIKVIVPFPPGGAADLVGRAFAQKLTESLGQPLVLENKPGADTIIGMDVTAKSPADGYTLVLAINSGLSMNPGLYNKLPYDPAKDFTPIAAVASVPLALVVPATSPAKSVNELTAMVKQAPDKYSYGAGNIVARLAAELLLTQSGGKAVPVMYRGSAPTLQDLMRGEVQFAFEPLAVVMPQVKAGKLRALAVATHRRVAAAPELPTVAETGLAGFEIPVWFGFMGPAGLPRDVVAKLHGELAKAARASDVAERLGAMGVDVSMSTPEQFAETATAERNLWVRRIRDWGIRAE